MKNRLAIVTSHPIQYNAPWFRLLAQAGEITIKVFYTWSQSEQGLKYDPGFGKNIEWDIPLLDGYDYTFVKNISTEPGSHHFKGIINPSLIDEIKKWQADSILVFGWSFKSHLKCIRYFHRKIPVLFRGDSTLLDEQPGIRKLARRFFLKWVLSHVDYALYTGTNNKQYFRKHGLKENELIFAPHAIDNRRFLEPDDEYEEKAKMWKEQLGIREDDLVLLFAGKLEEKKNPELLIKIAGEMPGEKIHFIFTGNGHLEAVLKEKAQKDGRIHFLDFQNQNLMPVVYRLADIFILPSRGPGETWGLAVNEAMACSKAVMVSDKCGCAVDLVKNGQNGIVFSYNDVKKCVTFLKNLLSGKDQVKRMGQQSYNMIRNYSYDNIVSALTGLMSRL